MKDAWETIKKHAEVTISIDLYMMGIVSVSYTHLRAHETVLDLVCRLLLEKKKNTHEQKLILYISTVPTTRYRVQ